MPSDLVYKHRLGETYSMTFNPAHRWFYVPRMQRDKALLIKCIDTATDIPARFTPHTAFADPTAPENPHPRESGRWCSTRRGDERRTSLFGKLL